MAEFVGNSRSQQLAAGQPSDVLALCWILASAERDRSLNLLGKVAALPFCAPFPRAREGGTPRPAFSIRRRRRAAMAREGGTPRQRFRSGGAGAQLWGLFGASRSKPLAEGWLWRVCALAFQAG